MRKFQNFLTVSLLICLALSCVGFWGGKKKKKAEVIAPVEPQVVEVVEAKEEKVVEEVKSETKEAVKEVKKTVEVAAPVATPAPVEAPKPKPVDPAAAVATINGVVITEGQLNEVVEARLKQVGSRIPPAMIDQYKSQIRKQAIDQLVIEQVLEKKIEDANMTVADEEIEKEITAQIATQNLSLDDFKALLQAYGKTYSDYQENVRKKVLFDKLLKKELGDKMPVPTVDQAQDYYNGNADQFQKPESIQVSHILLDTRSTDPNSDPNEIKAQAKAKAENILKQIKEGGDFAQLAKDNSSCPSAEKGGDLGMAPKGSFVPAFEAAAYALEPNGVSDIVETQFGYHIIKLTAKEEANTVSFDEAKDQILVMLEQQGKQGVVMEYIEKVRGEAKVEYANPADKMDVPAMRPPARKPAPKPAHDHENCSAEDHK